MWFSLTSLSSLFGNSRGFFECRPCSTPQPNAANTNAPALPRPRPSPAEISHRFQIPPVVSCCPHMMIPTSTQPAPASTVDMGTFFTVSRDTEPAASSASPAPSAASFAVACGDSNVALPIVPGHVASFLEPTPAVDWNARVLQGLDTSYAARLQRRAQCHVVIPPVATPTPPVAASTAPSVPSGTTDWAAELHLRFSESHSRCLEWRQLTDPYSKIFTRREGLHAAQQRVHDLRQENAKMAKRMIRADEEFEHARKRNDMDWDVSCACLDEAIEHRKQRKVADAWREHIFEERKGKTWEERHHLDQVLKEGPPPGWKPS
ncbi:uncharacterized protein EDB93DRAFT_1254991 [Suillus bovinus]|uniref:uncharacterized protein n=1 Tax=Suillus bovinus TaxID=48563 RepID=UPI001B85E309|nr:uncharacterized protein EDB93DRAFT_1254991 [Suillus bovinus]KAG2133218.1 hypothetical protein EDB93DRAFT_1254991 [Suillus bovinus]